MQLLRSMLFTVLFFLVTALYAVAVLLTVWMPHRKRCELARSWGVVLLWLAEKLCDLTYRVTGIENLPSGAHIAMWKHSSSWETFAQAVIFPAQSWVLKREIMWIPLVGWATHFMRPIAIDRGSGISAMKRVLAQGKDRLDNGLWVMIFPEGTRVGVNETRKYGTSGAWLAAHAGCKIVPVAHDAGKFWPRRGWMKKAGTIQVIIGPPIETVGRDPRSINLDVQTWIEANQQILNI
jgi:1-acyl-sn-glycerol-3-phosphate acyltransferase